MSEDDRAVSTLLLVDDEPALLRLVVRVLEGAGHRVLTAPSVEEGIAIFGESRDAIDAAILDVHIPPRGVGALFDAILDQRPELPVILTSGDSLDPALRARLEQCGGEFLRKPFLPRSLLGIVESAGKKSEGG